VEVQALVSRTSFGYPQRKANGFDLNRTGLLIAVLIKRCQINLANQDVHINIVGGLKIKEPAIDLGVALAMVSAFKNKVIDSKTAVFGEVGLGGEIRGVKETAKRIKEARKMSFEKIICPTGEKIFSPDKIIQVKNLSEAIEKI
jgi:DNA repair protein RadA/Sms